MSVEIARFHIACEMPCLRFTTEHARFAPWYSFLVAMVIQVAELHACDSSDGGNEFLSRP